MKEDKVNASQLLNRVPPHNQEAEEAVLGSLLINKDAFIKIADILHSDDFYIDKHQVLYQAMLDIYNDKEPIDVLSLSNLLKEKNKLDYCGGRSYLVTLTNAVPTAANIKGYATIVQRKATLRRLINSAHQILSYGYTETDQVDDLLDKSEQTLFQVSQKYLKNNFVPINNVLNEAFDRIDQIHRDGGKMRGVPTGFTALDDKLGGLQKSDLVILAARPSMGKCVHESTQIIDPNNGQLITIKEYYQQKKQNILTLKNNHKISKGKISAYLDDGKKPTYLVKTALGKEIKTTITHPFLTINGWKKLQQLKKGDKIGLPRIINVFGNKKWPENKLKLLAYYIADGGLTNSNPGFTNSNLKVAKDFAQAAKKFPNIRITKQDSQGQRTPSYFVANIYKENNQKNSITQWLEKLDLMGKNALQKTIPNEIFSLNKKNIALFLNRLFTCDGSVYINKTGQGAISYSSSNKELINQVQHLLIRFGIISKVREKKIKYKNTLKKSYELEIHNSIDIIKFSQEINIFSKEKTLQKLVTKVKKHKIGWNKDSIPVEIWDKIIELKGHQAWRSLYKKMGLPISHNIHTHKRNIRRETLLKLAQALKSTELKNLAQSDIYWDTIKEIKYLGKQQVYDLTIEDTHNFVANDFFVHNTSLALDIARQVAVKQKIPVGLFSLEMSKDQLVDRMLCAEANIDLWKMRTGKLSDSPENDDFPRIGQAMGSLSEAPIFIDDTANCNIMEIRTKARRLQMEHGLGLIVIDYLQLMEGRANTENRVQEISEISRSLKGIARELGVPVLALSQLSRAVEAQNVPIPKLSHLRESGAIEQDADVVMFIYREDYYQKDSERKGVSDIIIAKHRNGPTGQIELFFDMQKASFKNLDKKHSSAPPPEAF